MRYPAEGVGTRVGSRRLRPDAAKSRLAGSYWIFYRHAVLVYTRLLNFELYFLNLFIYYSSSCVVLFTCLFHFTFGALVFFFRFVFNG